MAERIVVACPAKINLFLRVDEPDRVGYHPLETEFQAIGLFDTLEVTVGGNGFAVEGMDLPAENTVTRTLRLMREVATLPPVGVRLIKKIPAQAGLGGGSSDAAGLLRVFRKLLPLTVPDRDFMSVARSVGADVPFFLVGGRAHGTGYGDNVMPLTDEEPRWLVVAKPEVECSTPAMYSALDTFRTSGGVKPVVEGRIENDFHAVAPSESLALMDKMAAFGLTPVGLCGSGSAVFGFVSQLGQGEAFAKMVGHAWPVRTWSREESLRIVEF